MVPETPKSKLTDRLATVLVLIVPLLALYPIVQTFSDWITVSRVVDSPRLDAMSRAYDWIVWQDNDGLIEAAYVHPASPAAKAGLRDGDAFYMLDYQQYFNANNLSSVTESRRPGSDLRYTVLRGSEHIDTTFKITRYPTFLYPTSATLWRFSMWGFALAAFFHLLGLIVATPLARRSQAALFSAVLIASSALWIVGNLVRIIAIDLFGPPMPGGRYDALFQATTLVSLVGWIAFPVLLVRKVVGTSRTWLVRRRLHLALYLPALVLGGIAATAAIAGGIGPFALDELVSPILFYASCYIALAATLILFATHSGSESHDVDQWNKTGSSLTLAFSVLAALLIVGIVPVIRNTSESTAGWFVVATQLLSTAPVILVSLATLRYGKLDLIIRRSLVLVSFLGLLFLLFVAGIGIIESVTGADGPARNIIAGLYAVGLVFVLEQLSRRASRYFAELLPSERQRAATVLSEFQDRVPNMMELDTLISQSINLVGEAFRARSAVIFIQTADENAAEEDWLSFTYHPEPPYVTESFLKTLWPYLKEEGKIWAYNPALNSSEMPADVSARLIEHGAALAIPIVGRHEPIGVIVLGKKRDRRSVYNLEDLEQIRWLCGQLGLAIDRLKLIEHQMHLARETTQAQLVALRSQINPHFLFNTLNTIAALIAETPDQAEATVEHLSSIFRHTLQARDATFVPLADELSLVEDYLAIEQVRFGDKLSVSISIPKELYSTPIPAFAVQTIVENAVKHGIEKKLGGGSLTIRAWADGQEETKIEISDTGIGIPHLFGGNSSTENTSYYGIGLANVSVRFETIFGRNDLLQITSSPDAGTTVLLTIPPAQPTAN